MIIFRNKGVIDPRSITTFGVSSKENSNAIGYFGTGLKYAIAILLREGCEIEIHTGGQKLEFGTMEQTVRVDEFTFVTMNGQPLAFTTELGKNWELWQAIREIWCNCLDEGGKASHDAEQFEAASDETVIIVAGRKAMEVWADRDQIILSTDPLHSCGAVDIHPGQSRFLYYKGVRVMELSRPSLFTYNVTEHLQLTEDRTVLHQSIAKWRVGQGVSTLSDRSLIQQIVTAGENHFEDQIDFDPTSPSEEFCGVVRVMALQNCRTLNRSAVKAAKFNPDELLDEKPIMQLSAVDEARMKKAVAFCNLLGFSVADYPIRICESLGEGVLGRAANEKIYLSKTVLMQGTKMVAGTLIEEFIHLRHGLRDESRGMQNFLFDALVSAGEQITGEPL